MSAMKFLQKNSKIRKLGGKYHKAGLLRKVLITVSENNRV